MNYIERSVYNIFDLVRDIGGLVSGLHGFFIIFVTILQYEDLHYDMIANLYTKENLDTSHSTETGALKRSSARTFRLNIHRYCPCIFSFCCKMTRNERLFLKGLYKYKKEIDIIHFFKVFQEIKV